MNHKLLSLLKSVSLSIVIGLLIAVPMLFAGYFADNNLKLAACIIWEAIVIVCACYSFKKENDTKTNQTHYM